MKIPVYLEDGETIETVGVNGKERMVHAVDARARVKMGTHVLMTKSETIDGKRHNVTIGLRPKTDKDFKNEKSDAEAALEKAKKDLEDKTKALEGVEEERTSGRKPTVRTSKK